jgi:hypothetical protein
LRVDRVLISPGALAPLPIGSMAQNRFRPQRKSANSPYFSVA